MVTALALLIASPLGSQGGPPRASATPAALELFESDWVLMNWALKYFDRDHDYLLDPSEAQAAADAFRKIADTNGDGRVTREEYRAARELILSKY